MTRFPRSIFLSLATFAALMCFSGPSVALEYEHGPPVSAYQLTDVGTLMDDFMKASVAILASDQVAIREQAPAMPVIEQRSLGELMPEYAESYDTHGLNFIDLRRRC